MLQAPPVCPGWERLTYQVTEVAEDGLLALAVELKLGIGLRAGVYILFLVGIVLHSQRGQRGKALNVACVLRREEAGPLLQGRDASPAK